MAKEYCYPFTRKSLEDYYEMTWRCAKCAYCRNYLPSDTEEERFGRQCPPGERFKYESYFASGRNEIVRRIVEGKQGLTERLRHILYTCTTCGACEEWCQATQWRYPLKIEMAVRKHFVEHGGKLLPQQQQIVDNIKERYNRLHRKNQERLAWRGKGPILGEDTCDIIYFVGCRSSFRRTEIAKSTYALLKEKLGLKVGFLSDERCCGRPLLDMGEEDAAVQLMKHNVDQIKRSGTHRVIFSCAECFSTFRNLAQYGIRSEFEAVHISQHLSDLVEREAISFSRMDVKATFHDPCYLGRHQGVYDEPRTVLASIPGMEVVEMPRNRKNAWCCGAGGGVREAFKDYSQWIAQERFEEVTWVQADLVITACPGCKDNLSGIAKQNRIENRDFVELVNELVMGT